MKKDEEILVILAEECAEVIQACMKIKRFGIQDNQQYLVKEIADVLCMIDLVKEFGILGELTKDIEAAKSAKRTKLHNFSTIFD